METQMFLVVLDEIIFNHCQAPYGQGSQGTFYVPAKVVNEELQKRGFEVLENRQELIDAGVIEEIIDEYDKEPCCTITWLGNEYLSQRIGLNF